MTATSTPNTHGHSPVIRPANKKPRLLFLAAVSSGFASTVKYTAGNEHKYEPVALVLNASMLHDACRAASYLESIADMYRNNGNAFRAVPVVVYEFQHVLDDLLQQSDASAAQNTTFVCALETTMGATHLNEDPEPAMPTLSWYTNAVELKW
jgi:hypothetical protein